jgi:deazaflavin-dependent oxidoreductase (nitroreductase family)
VNHDGRSVDKPPPGRWLRALYRAPLAVYRAGAGGLERRLGMRWILLRTRGRKTGRPHEVLVDVLGEDRGRHYVQAAYGRRADWVRNAEAAGRFEAEVGRDRFAATLEPVEEGEARRILRAYVASHPVYSPFVAWMLGYRGPLREPGAVADWLVERFGLLAIVRIGEPMPGS